MDEITSKSAWEFTVLEKWQEIIDLAEAFRVNHIAQIKDLDIRNLYAAKLTRMWLEVLPKVEGRTEFGEDFSRAFMEFRPFYFEPGLFFEKENSARIYELETCLRIVLERLRIT